MNEHPHRYSYPEGDVPLPEMPEPPEMLPLLVSDSSARYVDGLRLIVVWLGVAAFVVPLALVALGALWFPCVVLVGVFVLAAAAVSVLADSVEQ